MNRLLASTSFLALALAAAPVAAQTSSTDQNAPADSSGPSSTGSAAQVKQAQTELRQMGLYKGTLDGKTGPQTRQALRQYQTQKRLPQTGELDQQTLVELDIISSPAASGSTTPPITTKVPGGGEGPR